MVDKYREEKSCYLAIADASIPPLKNKGGLTPRVNSPYGRDSLVPFASQGAP